MLGLYTRLPVDYPIITDYQLAEQLGLELDYSDEKSDYRSTNFPARYIYERLLPDVVGSLSDIYYHRGSPYSGHGKPTADQTLGDLHQCELCSMPGYGLKHLYRERLARFARALEQLGYSGGSICIGIWNVGVSLVV
jgi:hypothetical protein